jgi:hypothetical protein
MRRPAVILLALAAAAVLIWRMRTCQPELVYREPLLLRWNRNRSPNAA